MSATLQAVSLAVDILGGIADLTAKLQTVNGLLLKAHTEGRDLTDAELDSIKGLDDAARDRLQKVLNG